MEHIKKAHMVICLTEFPKGTESMVGMDIWTLEQIQLHAVKNTNHVDQEMALAKNVLGSVHFKFNLN